MEKTGLVCSACLTLWVRRQEKERFALLRGAAFLGALYRSFGTEWFVVKDVYYSVRRAGYRGAAQTASGQLSLAVTYVVHSHKIGCVEIRRALEHYQRVMEVDGADLEIEVGRCRLVLEDLPIVCPICEQAWSLPPCVEDLDPRKVAAALRPVYGDRAWTGEKLYQRLYAFERRGEPTERISRTYDNMRRLMEVFDVSWGPRDFCSYFTKHEKAGLWEHAGPAIAPFRAHQYVAGWKLTE